MIRITAQDFKKLIDFLKKEGQDGAYLAFREEQTTLSITTIDKQNREMIIQLSDVDYPFMPSVTKKETF